MKCGLKLHGIHVLVTNNLLERNIMLKKDYIKNIDNFISNKKVEIEMVDLISDQRKICNSQKKFKNILTSAKNIKSYEVKNEMGIIDYINENNNNIIAFITFK